MPFEATQRHIICRYTGNHNFGTKCKSLILSSSSANITLSIDGAEHGNQWSMTDSQRLCCMKEFSIAKGLLLKT